MPIDQGEEFVLYDENGVAQAVAGGVAIPAGTRGLLAAGTDGANARFVLVDANGRPIVAGAGIAGSPAGGVLTVQGITGGVPLPIAGSITASNPSVGTNGAAIPTSSTQVGGNDGTNLRPVYVDTAGRQYVAERADTATVTSVGVTTTSTTLKAANTARLGLTIFNGSTNRILYLKLGSGASLTDYTVQIPRLSYYEVPYGYTGLVTGRWNNSGSDSALITELT